MTFISAILVYCKPEGKASDGSAAGEYWWFSGVQMFNGIKSRNRGPICLNLFIVSVDFMCPQNNHV